MTARKLTAAEWRASLKVGDEWRIPRPLGKGFYIEIRRISHIDGRKMCVSYSWETVDKTTAVDSAWYWISTGYVIDGKRSRSPVRLPPPGSAKDLQRADEWMQMERDRNWLRNNVHGLPAELITEFVRRGREALEDAK